MPRSNQEALLDGLAQDLLRVASSPRFTAGLERLGLEPGILSRKEFGAFIETELLRMKQLLSSYPIDRPLH